MTEGAHDVEAVVRKKVSRSTTYLYVSLLGLVGIAAAPLAFLRSSEAIKIIDETGLGESHRKQASYVRIISAIVFVSWVALLFIGVVVLLIALALKGLQ
jgi:hypothetical protein